MLDWNKDLSLEDAAVDEQHRIFIEKINQFEAAVVQGRPADEIDAVFKFLRDYAKYHFMEEERLMAEANYPGLQDHARLHDGFVMRIIEMKTELDTLGATPELYFKMTEFMGDWLVRHIRGADKVFAVYLDKGELRPLVA